VHFVRDNPGEPVPEETFTHSHSSWSSIIPIYLLHLQLDGHAAFASHVTQNTTTVLWTFVRYYLGEPVPEETFTHSHLS